MTQDAADFRDRATEQAAYWFAVLQQQRVSEAEREAFADWLARSAQHVQEYLAVSSAWRLSGDAVGREPDAAELIRVARSDLQSKVIGRITPAAKGEGRRHWPWAAGLAATLTAVAVTWLIQRDGTVDYRTPATDRLTVSLSDGSVVQLNTSTHVRTRLSAARRDIDLLEGEAYFQVARDPRRPFRVFSDRSEIRAVGTRFNVSRRKGDTTVTVIEGLVDVAGPGQGRTVRLRPAQQAEVSHTGRVSGRRIASVRAVTAWTQPLLRFSDEPLRSVLEQFNQYNSIHLVTTDETLGATRISGVFSSSDLPSFIAYLQKAEGVRIVDRDETLKEIHR